MPAENKTPNIQLNQWLGNEYPKRQDFVDDNLKIDNAVKAISDANSHLAGIGRTTETVKGNADNLIAHLAENMPHKAQAELDEYITRTDDKISKIELKLGSTVKYTENISRTDGKITSYEEIADGITITSTINRGTDGKITSITKAVS